MAFAMTVNAAAASEPVVRGLDHIPLAVNDLEASKADFEALGFVLKPGRPHENGLRNVHAKFPDGTEIELITVHAAVDALTLRYRGWLNIGDGPAFLGLYAPNFAALAQRLTRTGLTLHVSGGLGVLAESVELQHLFFAHRQRSTTDRPEHFDHANTAYSLAGVWLAGAEAELNLLALLGAVPTTQARCGPFGASAAAFSLPEAEFIFLPATGQTVPGRTIVGATVAVKSLEAVRQVLDQNRVRHVEAPGCDRDSIWVTPSAAHGMWLEFHRPPAAR
jgi:hypothetical protein